MNTANPGYPLMVNMGARKVSITTLCLRDVGLNVASFTVILYFVIVSVVASKFDSHCIKLKLFPVKKEPL